MTPAAALAAILLLLPATARAADEDWRAEWDKTVAAANKEGTVVLMVPPNTGQRNFLNREWPKAFPNIKLSLTIQEAAQWIQRVRIERGAGQYLWDAAMSGSVATFTVKNDGFVDPMVPEFIRPDVKDPAAWGGWDRVFYDNERRYVFGTRSFLKLPYYNAKLLSPEKVKRMGSAIFLDPELKGKIVWTDPLVPSAGESFAPVMRRILGDDGLRKFVAEQVVFSSNLPDLVDRMARG